MKITMSSRNIVILGAGISGLTTAYLLSKKGFDVTLLEKKNEIGGSIETSSEKGFLFDRGPNSGLETTPVISRLVDELNLKDEFVYANKTSNKRYILRKNELHPLPMNPALFLKTQLFSTKAKLRLMAEPFIGRSNDGYNQSIAEFVTRRLGKEFLDYAINPFVAGVYAGNPEDLSVKSAFPKLYELEEKYGGLILGTVRSMKERKKRPEKSKQSAKMFSFKSGMNVLPRTLSNYLADRIMLYSEAVAVEKDTSGYKLTFNQAGKARTLSTDIIISTIPAYAASQLFRKMDEKLASHLNDIYYPPVLVLCLGYNRSDVGRVLDGFGYLIPSKERKSYLGAIWSSVIFPNRAPEDKASFTLFIGGARDPEVGSIDKETLIKKVRSEFESLMIINSEPVYVSYKYWNKAIPQYNLGYIEHEKYFDKFEKINPGIILSGNYRGGISIGDCVKSAEAVTNKVMFNLSDESLI
ncbi:MAG TPA: protoporphyrinogen oxidase [Ignavibacteriaceae bacterium]|nr:protoporphyrinogen oxidase [Ignavibacteriaceae bacterium]